jgi:hypothetical protein
MSPSPLLLLCAGIIVAACWACGSGGAAPAAPAAPAGAGVPSVSILATVTGTGTGKPNCKADEFASAAMLLPAAAAYVPNGLTPPLGPYSTLPPDTITNPNPIWRDLSDAFSAAPTRFRRKLCMTTILIDQTACAGSPCYGNWGFRDPANTSHRYIGLSQSLLWGGGGHALIYSAYETGLIKTVLEELGMPWTSTTFPAPKFPCAMSGVTVCPPAGSNPVDTPATTVLAALAHEYGHILWADVVKGVGGKNAPYVPGEFCPADPKTGDDGFFENAWQTQLVSQPNPFIKFAEETADLHAGKKTSDLRNEITAGHWAAAADILNDLYAAEYNNSAGPQTNKDGIWPGLFGSVSPEEDLVETFKIYILIRSSPAVTSMPLNIYKTPTTAYTPDIFSDVGNGKKKKLKRKMDTCIDGNW